jgi:hypothetical protein
MYMINYLNIADAILTFLQLRAYLPHIDVRVEIGKSQHSMYYTTLFMIILTRFLPLPLTIVNPENLRLLHSHSSRSAKNQKLFLRSAGKVYDSKLVDLAVCQVRLPLQFSLASLDHDFRLLKKWHLCKS